MNKLYLFICQSMSQDLCYFCDGLGTKNETSSATGGEDKIITVAYSCVMCNGSGKNMYIPDIEMKNPYACLHCEGTGRGTILGILKCKVCHGTTVGPNYYPFRVAKTGYVSKDQAFAAYKSRNLHWQGTYHKE